MPQTFPSKYQGCYETATIPRALKTFLFSSQLFLSAVQVSGKLNYKVLGLGNLREYIASHSAGVPVWSGVKIHIHATVLKNLTSWFSGSQRKVLKLARTKPNKFLSETAWRASLETSVSRLIHTAICLTQISVSWQRSTWQALVFTTMWKAAGVRYSHRQATGLLPSHLKNKPHDPLSTSLTWRSKTCFIGMIQFHFFL